MADCIFCKIIQGEIPAHKIYEDEKNLAFLDINPLTWGHTVVAPKEHGETLLAISDESVKEVNLAVKKVTAALKEALQPDGFTIGINHQIGQAVPHLHIHILPRWQNDGGGNIHSIVKNPPSEELSSTAEKIKAAL